MDREAKDAVNVKPVHIDTNDLKRAKPPDREPKYYKDKDGNKQRQVTLKNFDSKTKIIARPYKYFKDWEKRGKYYSNQLRSPLQKELATKAKQLTGENFYSMANQGSYDLSEMPLHPLDVEKDVLDDFTIVLIGRRRSGKTFGEQWMAYHLRHRFKFVMVITGTRLNCFWAQHVPMEFIHDVDDMEQVIRELFARQAYIKGHPELGIDPRCMLILDDVMGQKYRTRFSSALSTIFTDGRHYDMTVMVALQDPKGIGPDLREGTDLCVIFRVFEGGRKEVIYEEWLSYMDKKARNTNNNKNNNNNNTDKKRTEGKAVTGYSGGKDPVADFFWSNTGMVDPKTGEKIKEDRTTPEKVLNRAIPQAVCVLQARNTEDMQKVFKKFVAEDPGEFLLGDKRYYEAAATGKWEGIYGTYPPPKRRIKKKNMH